MDSLDMLFYLVVGIIAMAFIIAIFNFIKATQERGRRRKDYGANHSYINSETTDNNYWGNQESQTTLNLFSDNRKESDLHSGNSINTHSVTSETNTISTALMEHTERHSSPSYNEPELYNNEHNTYSSDTNWGGEHESSHSSSSTYDSFDSSSSGSGSDFSSGSSSSGE